MAIAVVDHAHQLFTYPNEFLVTVGHRGSDNQGSTVYMIVHVHIQQCTYMYMYIVYVTVLHYTSSV